MGMNPIPGWVRRLWDVWLIRIIVLLSLTLQIILSIFGNRRKYVSSLWINILVWSAYLMADWVATVALGKLSDAKVDNDNDNALLRAIWAPMLLLHLGGPDTITAYSLEDNKLWMRHLLGVVVQLSVAVYVILMSWKHSWFSFMTLPALVGGIIKYGERTWVLMSVSHDTSGDIVPFGNLQMPVRCNDDVGVLTFAHKFLKHFKGFVENYNLRSYNSSSFAGNSQVIDDVNVLWNILEVEMGLMYDILYTKATIMYTKVGFIMRCMTFSCTMIVLVGLLFRLFFLRGEEKWPMVETAITGAILVGAVALEIYSVIALYISSDWAMIWLIKHIRGQLVIELRQRFPWLFRRKNQGSNTMGQFDLLGFCLKDIEPHQNLCRRILGSLLWIIDRKDMFNWYVHKTYVPVIPSSVILDYCKLLTLSDTNRDRLVEDNLWSIMELPNFSFPHQVFHAHIMTEMCYHLESAWSDINNTENEALEDRETSKTLSHYMMYLRVLRPSLLPGPGASEDWLRNWIKENTNRDERDVSSFCQRVLVTHKELYGNVIEHLMGKPKVERWKIVKFMWLRFLCFAAGSGRENERLQQLTQGYEFITFLWFFLPQSATSGWQYESYNSSTSMGVPANHRMFNQPFQLTQSSQAAPTNMTELLQAPLSQPLDEDIWFNS